MGVPSHPSQPCPTSGMHLVQDPRTHVQARCVTTQSPATQGDQVGSLKWMSTPSTVSGLSEIPFSPDVGQDGFMAEARGTAQTLGVAPFASHATSTSTMSTGQPPHDSDASVTSASKPPLFKLDKFDGSTSLDTFLWKFHQLAHHMGWGESDRFINLCSSLQGPAGQVFRELPSEGATATQLEELLHARFGTSKQAVTFEAMLHARRRQENEPLQELHRDISRLVQLAFPDQPASYLALVGRHVFLNALDDGALEYEVQKLHLTTLAEAADYAIHLESLAESVRSKPRGTLDKVSGRLPRQRNILAVSNETEPKQENQELRQRVAELEKQLKQVAPSGNRSASNSSRKSDSRRSRGRRSAGSNSDAATAGANEPSPHMQPCKLCNELGHWQRDCPTRKNEPKEEAGVKPVLTVSANMSPTKIYVTAEINGQPVKCLLDSGCERSVIAADLAPEASLKPSQYTLFAANKANLDVLGDTVLPFVIDGHRFEADVSVCSKVEDFLLGSNWLEKQGAQWDFATGTVTLGDRCIKVHRRNRVSVCRRVVVASDCIIPAKHEANVLVHMEDDGLTLPPYD